MNKQVSPANTRDSSPNITREVSIMQYNSGVATGNSKITLHQNMFSFLLEGAKTVQYAGKQASISPHQFLLLTAGNCLMSEKIVAPGGLYRSILFVFDNELLTEFFVRHPQPHQSGSHQYQQEPFLVFDKDPFLVNFIDSLGIILASGQSLSVELQKVKLEELLVYVSGCYPDAVKRLKHVNNAANSDMLIRQAATANICTGTTVEELAFLCNMSLSSFKRHFAKIFGTSPQKWLLEQRMQMAAQMLQNSRSKVGEIYMDLGYESLSSFIQSFKQIYGVTPKQYQRERLNV
jgi:AraC-like DNA-binding protein